tara:strand:- start:15424 stop:16002 length:579 start_codon:yes stop_codon:yes gene_type:complete
MTEVNLRKAAALQSEINGIIRDINLNVQSSFDDKDRVVEEMKENTELWKNNLIRLRVLNSVLFSMREKVAHKNMEIGISKLLTEEREVTNIVNWLSELVDDSKSVRRYTAEEIINRMEKLEKQGEDSPRYLRGMSVSTVLISKEEVEEYRKEIRTCKKHRQKITDKLLELNVSTTIRLSDKEEKVLQEEDLI